MAHTIPSGASTHCGVQPPPPGINPNCEHPETQTASNVVLHTIMIALATASLAIRLYTRSRLTRSIGLDDYLCFLGYASLVTYSGMLLACGRMYLGHHVWDIPKDDFIYGHKLEVISEWIYCFVSPMLKLAVLWLYRRIFGPQTRVNYIVNGGIIFIIVSYTALFFISLLSCQPFERRMNPFVKGYCLPSGVTAYLSGAINVLTDAFVVLLPLRAVLKLNMSGTKKLRAFAVFGLGFIVLALSITRLAKTPLVFKEADPTWELSHFAIYSILELYFGLMCACFIASPRFLDRFGPPIVRHLRTYTSISRLRSTTRSNPSNKTHESNSIDHSKSSTEVPVASYRQFSASDAPSEKPSTESLQFQTMHQV